MNYVNVTTKQLNSLVFGAEKFDILNDTTFIEFKHFAGSQVIVLNSQQEPVLFTDPAEVDLANLLADYARREIEVSLVAIDSRQLSEEAFNEAYGRN